jgi:hypothetical protein
MEKLELEMKLEILKKTYESSFLKNIFSKLRSSFNK